MKTNEEVEWWEMLDWNELKNAWILLSEELKNKVRDVGLAPDYDLRGSVSTVIKEEK